MTLMGAACLTAEAGQTADDACAIATDATVTELSERWMAAIKTRHPDRVARLFTADATMQGFASQAVRADYQSLREYYLYFLQFEPQINFEAHQVEIGCNYLIDSGNYTWLLKAKGVVLPDTQPARFRFVYEFVGGEWRISEHIEELTGFDASDVAYTVPDPQSPRTPIVAAIEGPAVAGFLKRREAAPEPRDQHFRRDEQRLGVPRAEPSKPTAPISPGNKPEAPKASPAAVGPVRPNHWQSDVFSNGR